MSWIISNPVDAFQLAWAVILMPCFLVSILIVVCWGLAAKLLTIKRCVLRRIALCLIAISCLAITALRVYQYAFPALNTEQGHENYSAHFNDMQNVQILAARRHGISPLKNRTEADAFIKSGEIVKITDSDLGDIMKAKQEYNLEQHIGETVIFDIANWIKKCK